jgi:hypothetical protein
VAKLNRFHVVLAFTAGILITFPVNANVVLPGDTVTPDIFPDPGDVPLLNHTSGTFSFGSGAGLITGTYTEDVAVDPFGVTCSGCLDFGYQVSLNSGLSAGIFALTVARYVGYSTDVGYINAGNPAITVPIFVRRGPFGGGLSFVFVSPTAGAPIGPGGLSAFLIVATDSKTYDNEGFLAISGGRAGSPASGQITGLFEPAFQVSVPEPSTAVLLGLGAAGVAGFCRKRRKKEL